MRPTIDRGLHERSNEASWAKLGLPASTIHSGAVKNVELSLSSAKWIGNWEMTSSKNTILKGNSKILSFTLWSVFVN